MLDLDRTNLKICKQVLENDLFKFKKSIKEYDCTLRKIITDKSFDFTSFDSDTVFELVQNYNLICSKLLLNIPTYKNKNGVSLPLHPILSNLQSLVLESCTFMVAALLRVYKSKGSCTAGVDGLCFTTVKIETDKFIAVKLSGTAFSHSTKSFKIKKDFPKSSIPTEEDIELIKSRVLKHNLDVSRTIIKKCCVISFSKNFKGDVVKRI